MIRSVPANASDSIYCGALGQYAVTPEWQGNSMLVCHDETKYVHVPLNMVGSGMKVDPHGNVWMRGPGNLRDSRIFDQSVGNTACIFSSFWFIEPYSFF